MVTLFFVPAGLRTSEPQKWKERMLMEFRIRRKRALRSVLLSGYEVARQWPNAMGTTAGTMDEDCTDPETCKAPVVDVQA